MKLSLNWLRDYVDLPADLSMEQLAYDLTMRTVEVEGVENPKSMQDGIVVGVILEVGPHPNADMLRVCQVDAGQDHTLQIVCGGSNLYVDQKVAVAVPGAMVRWHGEGEPVEIKTAELRGVLSEGMICGANELDLDELFPAEDEHEILDLRDFEAEAGAALGDVLELDDYILEIDNKSMTNRPDLWGHYGMARELAAIYKLELRPVEPATLPEDLAAYPVRIESDRCMRYTAAIFEDVTVQKSPYWLAKRLWSVGLRPINNLVDITNYVMLSSGQPTHGFDLSHVSNGIVVRKALAGEELELLDGTELSLDTEDLLITDGEQPLALAGVMGGKKDSILPETTSMILELASFNALSVRRTATRHGVRTESSTRFEKNIDTQRVDLALAMSLELIRDLLPEAKLTGFGEAYTATTEREEILLPLAFLASRIGREITVADVEESLLPLGFELTAIDEEHVQVRVPVWRSTGDVSLVDDLLEEVARMIGYENFDFIPTKIELTHFVNQREVEVERRIRETLAARAGFQEIFTYPWVHEDYIDAAGLDTSVMLELEAPPAPEERFLRASLVPGMIESIVKNLRYYDHFKLFELTQVYRPGSYSPSQADEVLPIQERMLCGALVGDEPMTLFREAKGVIEALPRYAQVETLGFVQEKKPAWADPKMWLNITNPKGDVIGSLALLSIQAEHKAGIKHHLAVLFELNVEALEALASRGGSYRPLPLYPEVWQDLNVVVPTSVAWADIARVLEGKVRRIRFIEEYQGKQLAIGSKSVIFRYWIGSDKGTLTSEEIAAVNTEIVHALETEVGATLRH